MWQERRTTTAAATATEQQNNAPVDTQEDIASTPSEPEEEENAAIPNVTITVPHQQLDPSTSTTAISKVGGRKRRKGSRSTASVEGLPLHLQTIDQLDGGEEEEEEEEEELPLELLITPGQGKDMDGRHLPPGVTKPPKRVKHPNDGIGVLEEIDEKEGLATYDFPSILMEVCISCTMCA